jgi:hypothetical protein
LLLLGRWSVSLQYEGQYQSVGKWHGLEDEGTGFASGGGVLRGTFLANPKLTLFGGLYHDFFSHGSSGQTFHQGLTVSVGVTRIFP